MKEMKVNPEILKSFFVNVRKINLSSPIIAGRTIIQSILKRSGEFWVLLDNRKESKNKGRAVLGPAFLIIREGTWNNFPAVFLYLYDTPVLDGRLDMFIKNNKIRFKREGKNINI